jgi:hypothetical protein
VASPGLAPVVRPLAYRVRKQRERKLAAEQSHEHKPGNMKHNTITAREAATLIEEIRMAVYLTPDERLRSALVKFLGRAGIPPLRECDGEAHDPKVAGQIDHCGRCAPRWGVAGTPVTVGRSKS